MSPALSSVQLFMLAGLAFVALGSLAASVVVRLASQPIFGLQPHVRHRLLVALAAAPVVVSGLLSFSAALPSVVSLLVPELDHCATHDDGHAHLCFIHLPRRPLNVPALLVLVFATTYLLARWGLSGAAIVRSSRLLRALTVTGLPTANDVTILETSEAVCMAGGLLRPRVLVSRGLVRTLPAGLGIQRNVFRQADFIEVAVHNVRTALRDGVALVLVIVLIFLASARASLVTIVAIPLSLVTAIFALSAFGATLNTMTLGGMAIAVGELVDDAVIDVENVVRRLRQNALLAPSERQPVLAVVLAASREIQAPMAVVILCGLASSTALNMFVVPALYRRFGALAQPGARAALTPASELV